MPDWLDPLYEAAEMRAVDAWAIEDQGVPSLDLMERAGIGLARVAARAARLGPVRVVVGKGNNGGDGLVAARLLREDGHEVDLLSTAPLAELRGDALANLERLPGDPPEPFAAERLQGSGAPASRACRASRWRARSGRSTGRTRRSWRATSRPA
jgi:NAD(P)H-hydrate epimerase